MFEDLVIRKESVWSDGTKCYAVYSDCESYRYILERIWDSSKGKIMFVGLNPSTATEMQNDPTVTRMISFAKNWGFGGIIVGNAFSFRATFPEDLRKHSEPIGKDNDRLLKEKVREVEKVVACWGNHGNFLGRSVNLKKLFSKAECFGLTKSGEPKHPLYLSGKSELMKF